MSGFSTGIECPNCGGEADLYIDHKPFEYTSISCMHCGLNIYPHIKYMKLEEMNEHRAQSGLKLLKKLPKQNKDLW